MAYVAFTSLLVKSLVTTETPETHVGILVAKIHFSLYTNMKANIIQRSLVQKYVYIEKIVTLNIATPCILNRILRVWIF